jgi:hypothetical protein
MIIENMYTKEVFELSEIMEDTSIYIYKSLDGVLIECNDPVRGRHTTILQEHSDSSAKRMYPYVGEKLNGYIAIQDHKKVIKVSTNWVVYHVEVFKPEIPGIIREVVIAWCKENHLDEVYP